MDGLGNPKRLVGLFFDNRATFDSRNAFIAGFSQVACARVFRKLMERLGFERFYLQGGDWGAIITSNLARLYPDQYVPTNFQNRRLD